MQGVNLTVVKVINKYFKHYRLTLSASQRSTGNFSILFQTCECNIVTLFLNIIFKHEYNMEEYCVKIL